jgi:hypothetical protein
MSLVRYRTNDYSVPTAYAHQEVVIKGYVDRVEVICRGERIAVHPRSYEHEDFIPNPLHYLALLEHKPYASVEDRRHVALAWGMRPLSMGSHTPVSSGLCCGKISQAA